MSKEQRNPSLEEFSKYTTILDLHNHGSTFSFRSRDIIPRILNSALKRGGNVYQKVIGLVNFNDDRYEIAVDSVRGNSSLSIQENNIHDSISNTRVVKGQEVQTMDGHLLIIGLNHGEKVPSNLSLDETLSAVKSLSSRPIVGMDHPYFKDGLARKVPITLDILEKFDFIETFNGESNLFGPSANVLANSNYLDWVAMLKSQRSNTNLGQLASSDGHSIKEILSSCTVIGNTYLAFFREMSTQQFNHALRQQIQRTNPFFKDRLNFVSEQKKDVYQHITSPILGATYGLLHAGIIAGLMASEKLKVRDYLPR